MNNVLIRDLVVEVGLHPTVVVKDLKRRRYQLGKLRAPSGQWVGAVTQADADRYLAERRAETVEIRPQVISLNVEEVRQEPQFVTLRIMSGPGKTKKARNEGPSSCR